MECKDKVLMRRFETVRNYPVYVNMDNVARIWVENEGEHRGQVAIMYAGGMTDHVKQTLSQVLRGY